MLHLRQLCRNLLCTALLTLTLVLSAAAVDIDLFPVEYTNAAGQTTWGYMNDRGHLQIDYTYATAEIFDPIGFAMVTNAQGQTALLTADGKQCTDWLEDVLSVSYAGKYAALRTATATTYYDNTGAFVATITGALGFPNSDRVCVLRSPDTETDAKPLYGFVTLTDTIAIAPQYVQAGAFQGGRALVLTANGIYQQIDTDGNVIATLPTGATPASLEISAENLVILQAADGKFAVYSLSEQAFVIPYTYDAILPFADGIAQVQQNGVWGLLSADGTLPVVPTYPYMNAMGEGMYAVRGTDGTVATINAMGDSIYQTTTYVGGFDSFCYGLSWHGTMEGTVVVYNAAGTMELAFADADRAQIVSQVVIRLEQGDSARYVDIFSKQTLYQAERLYQLDNHLNVSSSTYTKWLGMYEDGSDYGWDIVYPVLRGFDDATIEQTANAHIREFFLSGPIGIDANAPITATYGFAAEGDVLVVWAVGTIGTGEAALPWNDSIGIDLRTGAKYTAVPDLLGSSYFTVLEALLPKGENYGYPRMHTNGITWYCNHNASQTGKPYSEEIFLSFDQLQQAVTYTGDCYAALTGVQVPQYADISPQYWAYPAVCQTTAQGYLSGSENGFLPMANIEQRDVVVALARLLGMVDMPQPLQPYTQPAYADAVAALSTAHVLTANTVQPDQGLSRLELMRLLSAVYTYEKVEAPTLSQAQTLLAPYPDATTLTADADKIAVAHCLEQDIIRGVDGNLQLDLTVSRAVFAQVVANFAQNMQK